MKKESVAVLGKIAGFLLLQKTASISNSLIAALLAGLAIIAILSLMAMLLFGFLVLGGIYVSYQGLLGAGFTPQQAALITGGVIFVLLAAIIAVILMCVRQIKTIPKRLVTNEAPVVNVVSNIADAFVEGFRKQAKP